MRAAFSNHVAEFRQQLVNFLLQKRSVLCKYHQIYGIRLDSVAIFTIFQYPAHLGIRSYRWYLSIFLFHFPIYLHFSLASYRLYSACSSLHRLNLNTPFSIFLSYFSISLRFTHSSFTPRGFHNTFFR